MNKCKTCGGTGWLTSEKDAVPYYGEDFKNTTIEFARRCPDCNGGQAIVEHTKRRAQLPASMYDVEYYKDFNWDIYEDEQGNKIDLTKQQQLVELFIREYAEWKKEGIGLYIWSKTKGSGKTYLASAICNTLIKERKAKPKFVSASELINIDKSASSDKYAGRYDADPVAELCECDVLVLDDLGQNNTGGGWLEDILFRIFETRMQNKAITIVTSNRRIDRHEFDDRIIDRLNRIMQPIPLPDFRVRAKVANDNKRELLRRVGFMKPKSPEEPLEQISL